MTKSNFMRRAAMAGLAAVATVGFGLPAMAQKTKLTVYTALENDQLDPFKKAFEADNKDIEIAWVRDSTGVVTAKLIAEKDNPRADAIWGLAASSIALFGTMGMLDPYTPVGADKIKPMFKSGKSPDTWVGMDAYLSLVCFNTAEGKKGNKAVPASWADLIKPEYKDSIVMPNPASSGTGYLTIAAWLQIMGEEAGWKYMDALHQNIAQYIHSGSAPCVQAAKGERLIGIGLDMRGASEKSKGAPLELIVPKEGVGWESRPPPSSRAPRMQRPPRSSPTGLSPRRPTSFMPSPTPSSPTRASGVAAELSGERREGDDQERHGMDGQEPRAHPRRMDQALRRQVGAQEDDERLPRGPQPHQDATARSRRWSDVSLDVHEGEFVCFLGPSGCGKTTLLRAIAGLDPQTSGTIHQKGKDVSTLPPAKRDFGIVFQSYALFPNLNVGDNVGYGLVNRRMPRADIACAGRGAA